MPDRPLEPRPEPPKDQPGPPPQQRAAMRDAVQDVMRKVQQDRAAEAAAVVAKQRRASRRHTRGIVLVTLAAAALAIAVSWAVPRWQHPFAERSGPAADRDARIALLFMAKLVDAWAAQHHHLPASLHDVGVILPGITYTGLADHYELRAATGGHTVQFVSTQNREVFAAGR